jgi:hypothetical protein
MQAASAGGEQGGGNRQMKRWGPIIGVVAVLAVGGGILLATRGGNDSVAGDTTAPAVDSTQPGSTDPGGTQPTDSTVAGEITYPLSYPNAVKQGIADQIDWGDRCDTSTGRIAVPDFFRSDCFAPFTGDNGGATSTGVTADEITVVYYEGPDADPIISFVTDAIAVDDTNAQQFDTMKELVRYYETYYEFYGRKIKLIPFTGTGIATDEVSARADAAAIVEQYHPFAVIGGPALTSAFGDELAARKTLCVSCTPGQPPAFYTDRDPYIWGLDGSSLQKQTHVIEFIQKQLAGKNAIHAGDAFVNTPRKFGLLYLESSGASKDLADSFAAGMQEIGSPLADVVAYQLDPATLQQQASQIITKLKTAGVTTIVFSGDPVAPRDFTNEATAQEYFPEWVVAASTLVDVTAFARTYNQEQWKHAFGVTQLAARGNPITSGSYANYVWFTGQEPPANDSIGVISPAPALLFSLIQGVGPDLTPENFKKTLFDFAGTKKAISQPYLTYGDKGFWGGVPDYQGVDDATVFWWDATATGADEIRREGAGMYQYVDGGKRYLPGEWPTEDKLFNPEGAVAVYDSPPKGEERGDYPSPAKG